MEYIQHIYCYIEEYMNEADCLCARIRDKKTNKKVIITGENVDVQHFLRFLSQAKVNKKLMPSIYDQDGSDAILITGTLYKATEEELIIDVSVLGGGYRFI